MQRQPHKRCFFTCHTNRDNYEGQQKGKTKLEQKGPEKDEKNVRNGQNIFKLEENRNKK